MTINAQAVAVQGIGFAAISIATLGWLTPSEDVTTAEVGVLLETAVVGSGQVATRVGDHVQCEGDVAVHAALSTTADLSKAT
jgi:hypothetical protein